MSSLMYKDSFPFSCLVLGLSLFHVHSNILQDLLHASFLGWFWARSIGIDFEGSQCKYAWALAKEVNDSWFQTFAVYWMLYAFPKEIMQQVNDFFGNDQRIPALQQIVQYGQRENWYPEGLCHVSFGVSSASYPTDPGLILAMRMGFYGVQSSTGTGCVCQVLRFSPASIPS